MPMEKIISALKARRNFGQLLEEVFHKGDSFIVERAGKPMAVVVPIEQYMQWKEKREQFFAMIDEARQRNRDVPSEMIEAEVEKAVHQVREEKQKIAAS